jgi:hypothetical protein
MNADPRIAELEQLAREEGIKLPYPADMIAYFENQGRIVDLLTGFVHDGATVGMPTPIAKAIVHLSAGVDGN